MASFRDDLLSSLIFLPTANALGHLAPAIGASWAAVGMPIWDIPVLVLLFSVHALLDSYDKYRDVPNNLRPHGPAWSLWTCSLMLMIGWASYVCGVSTATRIVWYLGLEVFWAVPLVPFYTPKLGFHLTKLRQIFGPFKSAFCGVMAGLMDADPAAFHACLNYSDHCTSGQQRMQALTYSMLYSFVRESIYDARDIDEDTRDNVSTMATFLGMSNTIVVLLIAAVTGEVWIAGNVHFTTIGRAISVVSLSSLVATRSREKRWLWMAFSFFSLVPAWHAQAGVR